MKDQRGAALVLALLALLLFSSFSILILDLTQQEVPVAFRQRDNMQAVYLADAGVDRVRIELSRRLDASASKNDFDAELQTNGGYLFGAASGANAFVDLTSNGSVAGQYRVQIVNNVGDYAFPPDMAGSSDTNDMDMRVYVISTGQRTIAGLTFTKRVEALLSPGSPLDAFSMGCLPGGTSEQNTLTLNGNPTIAGIRGSVHSNCNVDISGNPTIEQNLTASGTITISGNPNVGGETTSGASTRTIPPINPRDYRNATYMLGDTPGNIDGDYIMIEQAAGGGQPARAEIYRVTGFDPMTGDPITTPFPVFTAYPGGGTWPPGPGAGWQYSGTPGDGGKWQSIGGNTVPPELQDRVFYFERVAGTLANGNSGNVTIGSNPGKFPAPGPWRASIVAEGCINISGNPHMWPANNRTLQLIAGTDLALGGGITFDFPGGGIFAAHEQIKLNGNSTYVGMFLAENAANLDTACVNETSSSGDSTITYNGLPPPPPSWGIRELVRSAWRMLP